MNVLAHALLSLGDAPGVMVGNLVADWIKGRVRLTLREDVRAGIELHRRIDGFTDMHGMVEACVGLLEERWGRYSPVLVDVLFDHVLATGWGRYCGEGLGAFTARTYGVLRAHLHLLPERTQYVAQALMGDDWFGCYATLDGVRLSFSRMSARLQHGVELADAVPDFVAQRAAFEEKFHGFFPQLMAHVGAESLGRAVKR